MFYIGVDKNGNIIECGTEEITTKDLIVYSFNNNANENPFYFFSKFKTLQYKYVVKGNAIQIKPQYNYESILIQEELNNIKQGTTQLLTDIKAEAVDEYTLELVESGLL